MIEIEVKGVPIAKKKCSRCQKFKNTSEFSKNRTRKDGFHSECKTCSSINCKSYRLNYCEQYKLAQRQRYYKIRDIERPKRAEYYRKHSTSILAKNKAVREENGQWLYKLIGGAYCRLCGFDKYESSLQLHHLDKRQKENHKDVLSNWLKIKDLKKFFNKFKELKFTILCANCHTALHNGEIKSEGISPILLSARDII